MEGKKRKRWQLGKFSLEVGSQLSGQIRIDGLKSRLYLYDTAFFDARSIKDSYVTGVLHDLRRVSLIDCVSLGSGRRGNKQESTHSLSLFPNFVVCGETFLHPSDAVITRIDFLVDDASILFFDFDAFGTVLGARSRIVEMIEEERARVGRPMPVGSNPIVQYFAGQHLICSVDTDIGEVSATHITSHSMGGPDGVAIKNKIWMSIKPPQAVSFHEAQKNITTILRFVEIIVGRRQNLSKIRLQSGPPPSGEAYQVFWSHPWSRKVSERGRPHPGDVLLDPVRETKEFGLVLREWLSRNDVRHDARLRFSNSFGKRSAFSINRLVASANAFDILRAPAVPQEVVLAQALLDAKAACEKIFDELPDSPERASILIALGRLGESTLKRKVRHRAKYLIDTIGARLPELELVVDEAVNCRNYFVHGGRAKFDYSKNFEAFVFLTETLEFVFAASELVECGWDIRKWKASKSGITNPIGQYIIDYDSHLPLLKKLLPKRNV